MPEESHKQFGIRPDLIAPSMQAEGQVSDEAMALAEKIMAIPDEASRLQALQVAVDAARTITRRQRQIRNYKNGLRLPQQPQ
jgi:hypothetical protein